MLWLTSFRMGYIGYSRLNCVRAGSSFPLPHTRAFSQVLRKSGIRDVNSDKLFQSTFISSLKEQREILKGRLDVICYCMSNIFKVPISWLGILHIYNIWNPVIRIAISCRSKISSSWTFWLLKLTEVTWNQKLCSSECTQL